MLYGVFPTKDENRFSPPTHIDPEEHAQVSGICFPHRPS